MHWEGLQQVKDEQGRKERQLKHAKRTADAKKKARAEAKVAAFLPLTLTLILTLTLTLTSHVRLGRGGAPHRA